jgi:hypothetical protein
VNWRQLVHKIAHRLGITWSGKDGWSAMLRADYLALDSADDDPLSVLQGHSINYRIALEVM